MARFFGKVGYGVTKETKPGVYTEVVTERDYFGDVNRNTRRWQTGEDLNDDLTVNNEFSIVADPYAIQNFHAMRYIKWMGARWKVTNVDVQYPRLILSVGGVYNGPEPNPEED